MLVLPAGILKKIARPAPAKRAKNLQAKLLRSLEPLLANCLDEFAINDFPRISHFLSQIATESLVLSADLK